jgi:hypothetical protein
MSVCLTRLGISLASYQGKFCWLGHGRQHALVAEQLARWLNSPSVTFVGYAEIRENSRSNPIASNDYATRQGIVLFKDFCGAGHDGDHIDVWDGSSMAVGDRSYFAPSREVWFWDLV